MSILELEFHADDWTLEKTTFGHVNLFVGNSGVGKTRILQCLQTIRGIAINFFRYEPPQRASWRLIIDKDGDVWTWDAEWRDPDLEAAQWGRRSDAPRRAPDLYVLSEAIYRNAEILIKRDATSFEFEGKELPRLNNAQSAVSLLQDEPSIAPLYACLSRIMKCDDSLIVLHADRTIEYTGLDALRNAANDPLLLRALYFQENYPNEFETLKQDYREIFPSVEDVKVGRVDSFGGRASDANPITYGIRESAVDGWVFGYRISSGMLRTLVTLLEIRLAPHGAVLLMDEVENSLGINCLGPIIDHVKRSSREIQFIMTSHHPYIINNIPIEDWHVVTRRGSVISVKNASEIPALAGHSRVDKFIRLINAPEFEDGVQ